MTAVAHRLTLSDRFTVDDGLIYLTGVQALLRMPIGQRRADVARGLHTATFISGYPGSPVGGFDLELQRRKALLAEHHIVHTMGVNEEIAATSVMGSQLAAQLPQPKYDGVVGIWYGKANGFDRALDAMRQANLCGTTREGGAVAIVGDDPTAKSSPTPGASEFPAAAVMMPMLYPGDVQEVLDLGAHAVALSRCTGLWTALKMSTIVADGSGSALVSPDRVTPTMVSPQLDGRPYVHVPSTHFYGAKVLQLERSMVYARMPAALAYARANDLNRITLRGTGDRLGVIASGKTYFDLRQACRDLGLDDDTLHRMGVRLLQLRMPYPLEGQIVREFAEGLAEILVLEDKRPFVELYVKDELYGLADRPLVLGKLDEQGHPLVPIHAELDTAAIARLLVERLRRFGTVPEVERHLERMTRPSTLEPLTITRSPYFCSGCPHSSSAAKVPDGTVVGAGTGCHVLAVFMRPEEVGSILGITAMGNEGAQWVGASSFVGLEHFTQNLGDGTYAHSGILGIRSAIAAGVNITYKLLYNGHVAMTGAQPPIGIRPVPDVVRALLAEGVQQVIVTTDDVDRYAGTALPPGVSVWDRSRMVEAQQVLREVPGVTVIVHDQECATELRRKRKRGRIAAPARHVVINERVCEGCGDCGVKSNCLSVHPVQTEFGRKTQVHQPSCNQDFSCLAGNCPSFLTVVAGTKRPERASVGPLGADELPEPALLVRDDEFGMRVVGIGGTGVVTVAQTVAVAALLDGRHIRGLDQTGLAQKGGPVISDLKISIHPLEQSNHLSAADCDLLLACDLLAGAQEVNLAVLDPDRTVAVASTARVPTGQMVVDTTLAFPREESLLSRITRSSRAELSVSLDAQGMSETLFGTDQVANIMLVGAAYQAGALPVTWQSLEEAIELNGVAVDANLQAFRRGRQLVADPTGLQAALSRVAAPASDPALPARLRSVAVAVRTRPGSALERLVLVRVGELTAYQNRAYAKRYAAWVERVRAREAAVTSGEALAETVAANLFKLMAYKDEYEVARLHLDAETSQRVSAQFGTDARVRVLLHPPVLKALGMTGKIAIPGAASSAMFRTLAPMKRLRGTPLDPFGRDHVRVVERALVEEYEEALGDILASLSTDTHEVAVRLASLPDLVRGYDEVKLRNVEAYRQQLSMLRAQLTGSRSPVPAHQEG
ncbi:MAG: indolepyruvate ferredoxin oxidoreductase family protein [Dermatophilaceae bacterium]